MSAALAALDSLFNSRGRGRTLDAFVVACSFAQGVPAWALGDGSVIVGDEGSAVPVHDGAVLAMTRDADGFLTGGDDGALRRVGLDRGVEELARYGSRWVEHVASFVDGKTVLRACAVGRAVHVLDGAGAAIKTLNHPSSVSGVVFDGRGKRVAASHYGGASLWFVASKSDNPRLLEWKGSHIGIAISPDGDAVVTAMQENALHGWRLSDSQHMRMSGYPSKPRALSFTRSGRWLASAGAEAVVLWPFFGGGPMGKPPLELGGMTQALCSVVVCHPRDELVAAGFSDGTLVLADIASERVLPVTGPGRGAISCLAWNESGSHLAFGTETGFAGIVDCSSRGR